MHLGLKHVGLRASGWSGHGHGQYIRVGGGDPQGLQGRRHGRRRGEVGVEVVGDRVRSRTWGRKVETGAPKICGEGSQGPEDLRYVGDVGRAQVLNSPRAIRGTGIARPETGLAQVSGVVIGRG